MSEVERLRAELKKARQSVTNKINRVKKNTGAKVAGSDLDPRRPAGIENRYNARQLQTHIAELKDFMRRGNQFVALQGGAPATKGEWHVYKRREQAQTEARLAQEAVMAKVDTPSGLTALQNKQMMQEGNEQVVHGPYRAYDRAPSEVASRSALKKLSDSMLNQIKVGYLSDKTQQGRENLNKALLLMGDDAEVDRLNKLSEKQFELFWFGTNVAEAIFMKYGIEKDRAANPTRKETWQDKAIEDAADELGTYLDWAETLPRGTAQAATKRSSGEANEQISNW